MTTQMRNGAPPTLASQIDRLDALVDGFSEALSGSVGEAVQQGLADLRPSLRDAARQAVKEALADPSVWPATLPLNQTSVPAGSAAQGGPLMKAALWLENAGIRFAQNCRLWWQRGRVKAHQASQDLRLFLERAWLAVLMLLPLAWMLRWHIVVAAGASVILGVLVLVAGPAVAVMVGMMGGFALVLLGLIVGNLWLSHLARLPVEQRAESGCSQPSHLN